MENVSSVAFWLDKIFALAILSSFLYFAWKIKKDFRLYSCLGVFLAFFTLFSLMRVALFSIFYTSSFSTLTLGQIASSFAYGMQFDLCTTATVGGLASVLFLLPLNSRFYYKVVAFFTGLLLALSLWASVGNLIYFSFVSRHTGSELWLALNDVELLLALVKSNYIWLVLLLVLVTGLMMGVLLKLVARFYRPTRYKTGNYWVCFILACVCIFFAFRGHLGFRLRPLAVADAYKAGNVPQGNLALNGVFCMYKGISRKYAPLPEAVGAEESLQRAKALLSSSQENFVDAAYPLLRQRHTFNVNGRGYNVVVLLLESWQYRYTDALAGTHYGASPHLDNLISQSLVFDQFYASGQRSINGVGTTMTGVAQLAGLPYFSLGLEMYHFTGLAQLLKQAGYDTVFAQPADWNNASVGLVAELAGFDEIYGRSDMTSRLDYISKGTILDHDALQFLADKLKGRSSPFLAFFFSAATHPPFYKLHNSFARFPFDEEDKGYLNALSYMDWSIGEFIARLKEQGQYERTIFVVLADHTLGWGEKGDLYTRFHIPLFIHAPGLIKPARSQQVGSQVDILPTILDMLHIQAPYAAMGNSLLDKSTPKFAFSSQDARVLEWVRPEGKLEYVGTQVVQETRSLPMGEERNLLALNRAVYELLQQDRWAPVKK